MSIHGPLFGQRRGLRRSHVLQPLSRFLGTSRCHVDLDVRLAADLLHEIHEFVGAEAIGVDHISPRGV